MTDNAWEIGRILEPHVGEVLVVHPRSDYGRFSAVLRAISGRRLTYAELTGRA